MKSQNSKLSKRQARKLERKLNDILYSNQCPFGIFLMSDEELLDEINSYTETAKKYENSYFKCVLLAMNVGELLNIEKLDVAKEWQRVTRERNSKDSYNEMPTSTHRDNKHIRNRGSNNYHRGNTVRLPKKNRSKRTWNAFYKLFPSYKPQNQ